ncbi:ATP-binding protein [Desulfolithobacter dissulfuricans]|uniref:ATP-binding protein n=1 Tax=Desulfolithobacter dissulfuricans TaxID=2795293 RepID=A0A915U9Y1_9BACT|nr:IS21-like element helper ATPase IstB [Desulfolithobacter dissulfuricans]BCO08855.1 ATP-binding protein [Desulfolithobacter dissulfuricans]
MHPMPELIPMLKQLRLSGIMDSLEIRNRQAIDEKMAYTDFLALLIQDEVARRTQRKFDLRIRRAGFRNQKTLEDFDFSFNPAINKAQIMDLATCRFMEEKACVLIVGPCGTGKSHIAQALGHCAIRQGRDVLFTTQTKLLGQLQAARATNSYDRRLNTLAKVDLLIIDDFGLKPLRTPQDEDIHDLIGERYERRSTIITSNLDLSEWRDAFPNKLLGAATIDRIRHGAYCVVLDGKSYRTTKPLPKPQKKEVEKRVKSSKN